MGEVIVHTRTQTLVDLGTIGCNAVSISYGEGYPVGGYVNEARITIGDAIIMLNREELQKLAEEIDKLLNSEKRAKGKA